MFDKFETRYQYTRTTSFRFSMSNENNFSSFFFLSRNTVGIIIENIYREIELTPDSHFYNIPVNTSFSSVHVPTNVYDMSPAVAEDIKRTEDLDNTFRQNYESDPALSWQYFGSVTGMLRQYPAMQWRTDPMQNNEDTGQEGEKDEDKNEDEDEDENEDEDKDEDEDEDDGGEEGTDIYDCRVRSWFIEAATCSKDMVILMDTSGSMTGMGKTIGEWSH